MNRLSSLADVTGQQAAAGSGMVINRRWLCGCPVLPGTKTGAGNRTSNLRRCVACVDAAKAAKGIA